MDNKEILTIIALSALGLCLLLGLAKMAMKSDKAKKGCDHACSLLVFVAVILVAVSQILREDNELYNHYSCSLNPKDDGPCQSMAKGGACGPGTNIKCPTYLYTGECSASQT